MTIVYIFLAALALGILVFIHELGHYFAARWMGMKVEVFSIGFGKPLLKWRWNEVDWQLCWLPFGGYVKISGMELSQKDKTEGVEPYQIPGGFFSKSPLKRIVVAIAGPCANFILAFVVFTAIWALGGREKPFSEFTQVVGWVDPHSELYALGLRPGDLLKSYDGKPIQSSKDLLYAAMLSDRQVELHGEHINYATAEKTPFTYTIESYPSPQSLEGIRTTGVTTTGRYLIYNHIDAVANSTQTESPMATSGIREADRLIWADGELLFSMEQLSYLINAQKALLTVKRGDQIFLSRQPRVPAYDLLVPTLIRNELIDWQYEAGIRGRWQDLKVLPYILSADAVVENRLNFVDGDAERESFPLYSYSKDLEEPLHRGDRIIAIDGVPITTAYQLLDLIQTHHVVMIAQHSPTKPCKISWKNEDDVFFCCINKNSIDSIAKTIGTSQSIKENDGYALLNPVQPVRMSDFYTSNAAQESFAAEYAQLLKIRDPKKRAQALQIFEQAKNKYMLGVIFQDKMVNYNPSPFSTFGSIFLETGQTLKALIFGYLNPKWISGPVGIVQVLHHGWKMGISEALFWVGAISLNLGMLNLLPIPVLDGGYICLSLYELVTRRRLKAKTIERLIIPFVILLIGLLIFLTFQDILRLFH